MSERRAPEYQEADRRTAREAASTSQAVVPAQRARQAVTGHNVRYVLGFGMAGIVVAFLIVYLVYFG
jgi:hypothetical protein